jgi:hypothetical protein
LLETGTDGLDERQLHDSYAWTKVEILRIKSISWLLLLLYVKKQNFYSIKLKH